MASNGKITEGSLARKDFAEHYGGFMELMYLVCGGDFLKMKEWDKSKTEVFLYIGEYLKRKRDTENMI